MAIRPTPRPARRPSLPAGALLISLVIAACGNGTTSSGAGVTPPPSVVASEPSPATTPGASASSSASPAVASTVPTASSAITRNPAPIAEGAAYAPSIDASAFTSTVDHPLNPLRPGTTFIFDGAGEHTETTVTAKTRTIMGVPTTVVHDRVFEDGKLIEDTEDYYAQDGDGNVWYFGEDTAECEGGKPGSREGAWIAGEGGAQPGVVMLADPRPEDRYRQEYLAGHAEDLARVIGTEPSVTVPAGTYADVLVTEETTPLEPDLVEDKVYAAGVGLIEERTIKGGSGTVTLTEIRTGPPDTTKFAACQG